VTKSSRFHIPMSPARPGDKPDFSFLEVPPAGKLKKPAVDAKLDQLAPYSSDLIRVLDDNHQAVGEWDPQLDSETLLKGLKHIMLTRAFDSRMQRVQRQGKISFYMQSTGEEAVSIAQCMALRDSDMLFPSYRTQGLHFVRGREPLDLMCQCLSNTKDMCKGRQMPIMYHWGKGNIFSISGNLTTQFPQAVGWAMAAAIKGDDDIAASWTGEGSTAESDFHQALTFAAVYQAPVILNISNNQWAISTFQSYAGGEQTTFAARGPGYGVPGLRIDGNDFLAVYSASKWAADRARSGAGPTLIEHVTYRAAPHSTSDDPTRYRPGEEWDNWPLGDPLERLKQHLIGLGDWSEEQHQALSDKYDQYIAESWKTALSYGTMADGPKLNNDDLFEDVFKELPQHLREQREQLKAIEG